MSLTFWCSALLQSTFVSGRHSTPTDRSRIAVWYTLFTASLICGRIPLGFCSTMRRTFVMSMGGAGGILGCGIRGSVSLGLIESRGH